MNNNNININYNTTYNVTPNQISETFVNPQKQKELSEPFPKEIKPNSIQTNKDKKEDTKTTEPNEENPKKKKYMVKKYGKMGWICKLCENFNYETRRKCNRCGQTKRPKKIKNNIQNTSLDNNNNNDDNNNDKPQRNKKEDWTCIYCKNLNYSFRKICNKCKVPKMNAFFNIPKIEINFLQECPVYNFEHSLLNPININNQINGGIYYNNNGNNNII